MAAQTAAEKPRTRAEIEADIEAARQRLASNIAGLIDQVHPKAIVRNTVADAREFVGEEFRTLKDRFAPEEGVDTSRVALAVAAAAGAVAFVIVVGSIIRGR